MASRMETTALTCHFDRFDNGRAVLRFPDEQELIVARRLLPAGIEPGQILELHIHTPETAHQHRDELARAVLNEILNG